MAFSCKSCHLNLTTQLENGHGFSIFTSLQVKAWLSCEKTGMLKPFIYCSARFFSPLQTGLWDHCQICRSFPKSQTDLCLWWSHAVGRERQANSWERSQQGQHRNTGSTSLNHGYKDQMHSTPLSARLNRAFTLRKNAEDEKKKIKHWEICFQATGVMTKEKWPYFLCCWYPFRILALKKSETAQEFAKSP